MSYGKKDKTSNILCFSPQWNYFFCFVGGIHSTGTKNAVNINTFYNESKYMSAPHHTRYIDEFIKLACAPDLLARRLFPNGKEITESMAMFQAMRSCFGQDANYDMYAHCVVVGDGNAPRTASLICFRTSFQCHSIDPKLRNGTRWMDIRRLFCYPTRIEEQNFIFDSCTFLLLPHSHVSIKTSLEHVHAPVIYIITMDCCYDTWGDLIPDVEYKDESVWSEKNCIKIKKLVHF